MQKRVTVLGLCLFVCLHYFSEMVGLYIAAKVYQQLCRDTHQRSKRTDLSINASF